MTSQAEKLLEDAMRLPPESRAALAGSLLSSLEPSDDEDVAIAWRMEVASRLEELDSGQVEAVSWEETQRRIFGTE
jgi:putative addiction module component (TIGR02574 family)